MATALFSLSTQGVSTRANAVKAAYFLASGFSSIHELDVNGAMDTLQSELAECMLDILNETKLKKACVAEYCPFAKEEDCRIE